MKISLRNLMAGLGTALFLAACGGGGGDDAPAVTPPTAVLSASAESVPIGTAVTLDGSGSTTPNNGTITYAWNLSSRPDGSAVELSGTDVTASFTPDVEGNYVAELTVNDGTASNSVTQTIAATNPNPVAVITPDSTTVLLGNTVTLDGSGSRPPTGEDASALSYQWTLTEQPEGDTTTLDDATASSIGFLAATEGVYKLRLVVAHGDLTSSAEAEVLVNTANSSPVIASKLLADGVEVTTASITSGTNSGLISNSSAITRGQTVTLDASASTDPDGDTLHYRWFFTPTRSAARPYGSSATISNHTSAQASFVPDSAGTYYVTLTIYDQSVATTQEFLLAVTKAENDTSNTAPVAVIWGEYPGDGYECETGAYCYASSSGSYDVDGDELTYNWVWWNVDTPDDKHTGTGSSLVDSTYSRASTGGTYTFELTVNDGKEDSATVSKNITVKTGANVKPVARIEVPLAKVLVGGTITFDGSTSSDGNTDQISYQWTLTDRPDGSTAVLQNATSEKASVVADQPGIYTVQLVVTDSKGLPSQTYARAANFSAFAKTVNNPPVVSEVYVDIWNIAGFGGAYSTNSADDQPLVLKSSGLTGNFRATFIDPDLDTPIYYFWTTVNQPEGSRIADVGSQAALNNGMATSTRWTSVITTPGNYELEVLANDGVDSSETKSLAFSVVNREDYPSLLLEQGATDVQRFFPYQHSSTAVVTSAQRMGPYKLTAFDQSYTIQNLSATSAASGYTPNFEGLTNGQVINVGESVEFYLLAPEVLEKTQFEWKFDVAERPGFTFSYILN